MAIWGHETVHVEKDVLKREWRVSTARPPRQVLVTIPWADAFRVFTPAQEQQYADYIEAIATCQSHRNTALTRDEEQQVADSLTRGTATVAEPPKTPKAHDTKEHDTKEHDPKANPKVVSLADFRRRRR